MNPQLIRYAGFRSTRGRVIGDPLHVDLTDTALALGWRRAPGPFEVLPLIVADVDGLHLFELPRAVVLEVHLEHPRFPWFKELGLRWHANPAVSHLALEVGGVRYPAAPFTGWYVSTEISARNLSDHDRYDMLPTIARKMGLDTSRASPLWKDRAVLELTEAVVHSYASHGVYMVDHHTAADRFVDHVQREKREGRSVQAEWSWVNPPISAGLTATYRQTFDGLDPSVRPDFVAQAHAKDGVTQQHGLG